MEVVDTHTQTNQQQLRLSSVVYDFFSLYIQVRVLCWNCEACTGHLGQVGVKWTYAGMRNLAPNFILCLLENNRAVLVQLLDNVLKFSLKRGLEQHRDLWKRPIKEKVGTSFP